MRSLLYSADETQCTRDFATRSGLGNTDASAFLASLCRAVYDGSLAPGLFIIHGVCVRIDEGGSFVA